MFLKFPYFFVVFPVPSITAGSLTSCIGFRLFVCLFWLPSYFFFFRSTFMGGHR